LLTDSASGAKLLSTLKVNNKIKHLNVRVNSLRQLILDKVIEIHFVSGSENCADMLTKPLSIEVFLKHRQVLMKGHNGVSPFKAQEQVHSAITSFNISETSQKRVQFKGVCSGMV